MKGTTGDPLDVIVTPNEVTHAVDYPRVALFVVSNIHISRDEHDEPAASGGDCWIYHPWVMDPTRPTPLGFKYRLPPGPAQVTRATSGQADADR